MNDLELQSTDSYVKLHQRNMQVEPLIKKNFQESYTVDYADLVRWMKTESNPFGFNKFTSTLPKPIGPLVIWCKKLIRKVLTPVLKICFKSQRNMNDLTVTLAQIVCVLESRIQELEKRLPEKEVSD